MIRFSVKQGAAEPILTDWEEEHVRHGVGVPTAVARMNELRRTHGSDARISIERTTVIAEPDRRQVRFKIVTEKPTHYSLPFPIAERDERLAEMRDKHRKAEITEEVIGGSRKPPA